MSEESSVTPRIFGLLIGGSGVFIMLLSRGILTSFVHVAAVDFSVEKSIDITLDGV